MAIRWEQKRPDEVRDYSHDWSAWLDGDVIDTSVWDVSGVTKDADSKGTDAVTIWLSAGVDNTVARLINTITTAGGRRESQEFALIVREADEPITLEEARKHLRVDSDADGDLILDKIASAREWVEDHTGLILMRREVTETLRGFVDQTKLRAWPIDVSQPVTLTYRDSVGATQTIADAVLWGAARPAVVYPAPSLRWPLASSIGGPVTATFTAGFAHADSIPQVLRQAMLVMLTAFYEDREGGELFQRAEESARGLCRRYKRRVL